MPVDLSRRKLQIGDTNYPAEYNQLIDDIEAELGQLARGIRDARRRLDNLRPQQMGDGAVGTLLFNVAKGLFQTGSQIEGKRYFHIKLPLKITQHNEMFWLKARGYNVAEMQLVDATFSGYCYQNSGRLYGLNVAGNHAPAIYVGTNHHVYCRLETRARTYYITLAVDTMRVGNGRLFTENEVEIIQSARAQL